MSTETENPLLHWLPYKLIEKDSNRLLEWIYLGDKRFTDPFFDDTIAKCRSNSINSKGYKVYSSPECLLEWAGKIDSVDLAGLIFHVSRCGSTMISQLMAEPASNIMISEAPLIDQILQHNGFDLHTKTKLIHAVVRFLGKKRFSDEERIIIKLDAWHLLQTDNLRMMFPDLPFMMLYRKPSEVLLSHHYLRGMHMVPGTLAPAIFSDIQIDKLSLDEYGAKILEKYYTAIYDFSKTDQQILLCDYETGMEKILAGFNTFLGIAYDELELKKMHVRLQSHSKNSDRKFTENRENILQTGISRTEQSYQQLADLQ